MGAKQRMVDICKLLEGEQDLTLPMSILCMYCCLFMFDFFSFWPKVYFMYDWLAFGNEKNPLLLPVCFPCGGILLFWFNFLLALYQAGSAT